jgi:hypothetical protein
VNDSALIRARAGDHQAFAVLTDPYRRELQLHCYQTVYPRFLEYCFLMLYLMRVLCLQLVI